MLTSLFKPKPPLMLGLDIGTKYVKAILLEQKGNHCHIKALACEPILGDVFTDREIKDFDALNHAIKKVQHSIKVKVRDVAIAVSGTAVLTKVTQMPSGQSDIELEGQIELEADSLIPYPLDDVYLDFEVLGTSIIEPGKDDVLLSVSHKNMIDSRITLLRELELEPRIVDIEGYALGNSLIQFTEQPSDAELCCLCIGASQLQLTVIKDKQIRYAKELPFGTEHLIRDLSLVYNLEPEIASKQLESNQLPEHWQRDIYPQFLGNLQQQINRVLQLYQSATNDEPPKSLMLCGGAAKITNLVDDLASDLNLQIQLFNPLANMTSQVAMPITHTLGSQFAIAAGLASRSFTQCHI